MGLYRRLFKGASSRDSVAPRSPEVSRAGDELTDEIRDLKNEIRKLREALLESPSSSIRSSRGRRGGRSRSTGDSRSQGGSFSAKGRREGAPRTPPDDAPVGLLVDYLKKHKVVVFEGQDDLAQNEAFEHLARHIGQHFDLLAPFYEKMKRAVATGRTTRVDIDNYNEAERSAAVQLGTLLYRHGMLKDFYYHRSPRKQLRVIPNKDGEIQQFLTGGWLEIYVVWLLSKRIRARVATSKFQVMFNVKGTLPEGNEFEADYMACIEDRLLWLECKTGQWQDYSARFRGLVKVFGTDRKGAGLILIKSPDSSTRARATDMLDMTLLALGDVETYVDDFLEVPKEERLPFQHCPPDRPIAAPPARERRAPASRAGSSTASRPVSDQEIPLEDAEPAKRLGKVELEGGADVPRRRRRRRGGRGRGSGGGSSDAAPRVERDPSLKEDLPIQPSAGSESETEVKPAASKPAKPLIPAGMMAPKPVEDKSAKAAKPASKPRAKAKTTKPSDSAAKTSTAKKAGSTDEDPSTEPKAKAASARAPKRRGGVKAAKAAEPVEEEASTESESPTRSRRRRRPASAATEAGSLFADQESTESKTDKADSGEADKGTAAGTDAKEGGESRPANGRRRSTSRRPRRKVDPSDSASESRSSEPESAPASDSAANSEKPVEEKPARKPRRRPATRAKAESGAEGAAGGKEAASQSDSEVEARPKPARRAKAAPKATESRKPKVAARSESKAADRNEPKEVAKPKAKPAKASTSPRGVTITPDLAAMMAGGSSAPKAAKTSSAKKAEAPKVAVPKPAESDSSAES
jgi:hypothetical protein